MLESFHTPILTGSVIIADGAVNITGRGVGVTVSGANLARLGEVHPYGEFDRFQT